jgi:spore germination protein KC
MGGYKWIRTSKCLAAVLLILASTTGCWDRLEIEERAVVLGIGIDQAEPEAEQKEDEVSHIKGTLPAPKTEMIRITVQIAVPGRIPLGPGGSGGGGSGGGEGGKRESNTVWVVGAVGHTIDDAINGLQQRVGSPMFFGHLRIIVLSEKIAMKGMENLNDYFRRSPDIRRMNWMMISKGKAMDIMKASPQLERVPSLYLLTTMDQAVKLGKFPNDFLGIFWSASSAKGKEGYLPYVDLKSDDSILLSGLAYFRGNKMVGTTNPLEIPLFMGITGMNPAGGQAYVQVPGTSEFIEFTARNRKSITKVKIEDGRPRVQVKIYIDGNLREKSTEQVPLSHEVITQIENDLEKDLKEAYQNLISRTQEKGSDIFGFGEYVRAKEWRYWNQQVKTGENWQNIYRDIPIDLTVQIHIRRIGMKAT